MRLLNSNENKELSRKEEDKNQRKIIELNNEVNKLTKNFNVFKEELFLRENGILQEHKELIENLDKEKDEIISEVKELEFKRDNAMKPLEEKERILSKKESEVNLKEDEISSREKNVLIEKNDLNILAQNYEEKLDDLSGREEIISNHEQKLNLREKDFAEIYEKREKDFEEKTINFNKKFEEFSNEIKEFNKFVISIKEIQMQIEKDKEYINNEKKHIKSQQTTLKLAFEEARQKGII